MADNAPYKIVKSGDKFNVVNNAGIVKASFDTHEKARTYQKALYANVPGAASAAANKPWTGKAQLKASRPGESKLSKVVRLSGRVADDSRYVELFNHEHDAHGRFNFGESVKALPASDRKSLDSFRPKAAIGNGLHVAKDQQFKGEHQTYTLYHQSNMERPIADVHTRSDGSLGLENLDRAQPTTSLQKLVETAPGVKNLASA